MLLELANETTTWSRPIQPTAPNRSPSFISPSVIKTVISTSESSELAIDKEQSIDGIRILDGIAPLERERYFRHSLASRLEVLQSWEGAVIDIDADEGYFTARLYDLTSPEHPVSEAEMEISDVSRNDQDLLKVGGIFRWMIGYRRHSYGQQERVSAIVFRRLPGWTEGDIAKATEEGERLAASLVFE